MVGRVEANRMRAAAPAEAASFITSAGPQILAPRGGARLLTERDVDTIFAELRAEYEELSLFAAAGRQPGSQPKKLPSRHPQPPPAVAP